MLEFIKNNWLWLVFAFLIINSIALVIFRASKRKDSDFVDNQEEDEDAYKTKLSSKFFKIHGIDEDNAA